jgi:menaquinol-cytochrome c reductase iron-sulfur subunit
MAHTKPGSAGTPAAPVSEPPRRPFLYNFITLIVGAVVGLVPLVTGAVVFFDPLRSRGSATKEKKGNWIRVATIDGVPPDGIPRQFPVIADLVDAWNRTPNQPVGSVYLCRHSNQKQITALNAICPHAGCFVAVVDGDDGNKQFGCPCHTSAFNLADGAFIFGPSPRGMDPLEVDQQKLEETGEVWIDFKNFYPGKHERKEKA